MNISSRTPEGTPNKCPVCQKRLRIEPSSMFGDAPCPHCGTLLWFIDLPKGLRFFDPDKLSKADRKRIKKLASQRSFRDSLDKVELFLQVEEALEHLRERFQK